MIYSTASQVPDIIQVMLFKLWFVEKRLKPFWISIEQEMFYEKLVDIW